MAIMFSALLEPLTRRSWRGVGIIFPPRECPVYANTRRRRPASDKRPRSMLVKRSLATFINLSAGDSMIKPRTGGLPRWVLPARAKYPADYIPDDDAVDSAEQDEPVPAKWRRLK